jgi:hypothetical protein
MDWRNVLWYQVGVHAALQQQGLPCQLPCRLGQDVLCLHGLVLPARTHPPNASQAQQRSHIRIAGGMHGNRP